MRKEQQSTRSGDVKYTGFIIMEDSTEVEESACNVTVSGLPNCSNGEEFVLLDTANSARIIVPLTLGVFFIAGVTANVFLLWYVVRGQKRKTRHIILIASLSVSDLAMLLIGMPFVSTIYTFDEWPYGGFICKLSEFAQTLSASAAVLNLTALSADRYFIISSKKSSFNERSPVLLLFIIWVAAVLFSLPDLVSSTILTIGTMEFCIIYPASFGTLYREFHIILKFIFIFILPLITISVFYSLIACKLRTIEEHTPATNSKCLPAAALIQNNKSRLLNRKRKVTSASLALVVVFIVTWLPRYVYLMWFHFDPSEFSDAWFIFKIVSFCVMFTNSVFNPFIYGIFDRSFRHFVCRVCKCATKNSEGPKENDSDSNQQQEMTMTVFTQQLSNTV